MGPSHHPDGDELLAYVTGTCETWLSTLIACHLTLCPRCRDEVALLESLGGALFDDWLEDEADEALECADHVQLPPRKPLQAVAAPAEVASVVPRPLLSFLADSEPRFRFLAPGLSHMPLNLMGGDRPLRLVRFNPGFVVPEHSHAGLEWLLILTGEVHDRATGDRFRRGDISRRDVDDVHAQVIGKDEPCIAVFANIGPPIPRTLLGKVLARIVGL